MSSPRAASRLPGARWALAVGVLALLASGCGAGSDAFGPAPRHVLLVTVDTLRADRLGAYGSALGATPALDAFAAESVVFEAAYASAPLTFPSVATLFTGRYPAELGVRSNRSAVPEGVPTLASVLREQGFATAAVVSNFVLRDKSGLSDGFDHYDDHMPQAEATRGWPERLGPDTTDAALARLAELRDAPRWLLWVHYQDPHGPYTPPREVRERFLAAEAQAPDARTELPEAGDPFGEGALPHYQILGGRRDVAFYRAGYHGEITRVDAAIGRLLAGVEAAAEGEVLAVFAADHGEALGEHDFWFAHGHHLTDELVRVPLWMRVPGRAPGRRDDVVSLADVFPTIVSLVLGEQAPRAYPGRDLFAADAAERASTPYLDTLNAYRERRLGLVEDGYKLILTHRDGQWHAELFRQGRETVDLSAPAPQVVARLRERLDALRVRYDRGAPERREEFSEEEEEALRALGYLELEE